MATSKRMNVVREHQADWRARGLPGRHPRLPLPRDRGGHRTPFPAGHPLRNVGGGNQCFRHGGARRRSVIRKRAPRPQMACALHRAGAPARPVANRPTPRGSRPSSRAERGPPRRNRRDPRRAAHRRHSGRSAVRSCRSPVRLGGELYCDGGLRPDLPLYTARALGARRLLVVSPHSVELIQARSGRARSCPGPAPS